jgi:hypothetical protein
LTVKAEVPVELEEDDELLLDEDEDVVVVVGVKVYESPAQTVVVPVVATTVLPESISSAAERGSSRLAMFRFSVAGEPPEFVTLA